MFSCRNRSLWVRSPGKCRVKGSGFCTVCSFSFSYISLPEPCFSCCWSKSNFSLLGFLPLRLGASAPAHMDTETPHTQFMQKESWMPRIPLTVKIKFVFIFLRAESHKQHDKYPHHREYSLPEGLIGLAPALSFSVSWSTSLYKINVYKTFNFMKHIW